MSNLTIKQLEEVVLRARYHWKTHNMGSEPDIKIYIGEGHLQSLIRDDTLGRVFGHTRRDMVFGWPLFIVVGLANCTHLHISVEEKS